MRSSSFVPTIVAFLPRHLGVPASATAGSAAAARHASAVSWVSRFTAPD